MAQNTFLKPHSNFATLLQSVIVLTARLDLPAISANIFGEYSDTVFFETRHGCADYGSCIPHTTSPVFVLQDMTLPEFQACTNVFSVRDFKGLETEYCTLSRI
jgi:hypothetical protein